ncbi:MAG: alpha/beta hydrolase [Bacteroidales bacterium]|jgi:acetyl esterase/lipase|nr:alpha/beta hydrolase [Bacteroidales bacterium]
MIQRFFFICFFVLSITSQGKGQDIKYQVQNNIPYYSGQEQDAYAKERCVLDIYYPENKKEFATVIWFHGGGITGGNKHIPQELKEKGICIVAANYRLHPKATCPKYIEDAASAVAWTFKNIEKYGGDTNLIFVSGHSAGGYLAAMVGLDKRWLKSHDIDADRIAGLVPFSGHTITHMTIRKERGISDKQPVIDEYAPLFHVRPDAPPLLLMTGDRELEMLGRYEENAYLMRMMKIAGHKHTILYEFDGYGHDMLTPAYPLLLEFIRKTVRNNSSK